MNIKDIARIAEVSVSTVSKVMNGKDASISPETRERVLKTAREYNYAPYASVLMPSTRTFQIGVLFCTMDSAASSLSGILTEARKAGYSVSVAVSSDDPKEELKALSAFLRNNIDVLLWEPAREENPVCKEQLAASGTPYIRFHSENPADPHIDFELLGYQAVSELVERGHRDIACILSDGRRTTGFFEGYKKCLFDHEIPFREELVFREADSALFYQIVTKSVSAIVCSHFSAALALYGRCSSLKYHAPEDFSIISLKDDARIHADYPAISSYPIPHAAFGAWLIGQGVLLAEKKVCARRFQTIARLDSTATIDVPFFQRSRKITVVGSINIDDYLNVLQLPASGKTVRTSVSSHYPGGKGMNEAIGAAKLGHRVSLIGNVGGDLDSNLIYDTLREHGVDTSGLIRCRNLPTGRACIIVDPTGDSMISVLSGAGELLREEDVRSRERSFEHTGYTLISTEVPIGAVREACRLTRKYGGQTIVKPSALSSIPEDILQNIDILVPNQNEMDEIAPELSTLAEKADHFLQKGVQVVIVTLGAEGCYLKTAAAEHYYPAMNFEAVDNTGAADAFVAALASYLLHGAGLDAAIRIASYAAGFSITREGVVPALIDRNSLETYIHQREPELLSYTSRESWMRVN